MAATPLVRKRGYCTLCRSRCGAVYSVQGDRLVDVQPDAAHPTGAALCSKGRAAAEIVHSPRRLRRPLRRTTPKTDSDPGWAEISWDEALDEIANRIDETRRKYGAEAVAFAVTSPSGTPLSDGIDWLERFIRLFGSPNIAYATEICNWHKDHAHAFTFGCGIPVADYTNTDLVLLWGHNPARSWLAQSTAISKAQAGGARVAVVDPRRAGSAQTADLWLRVRPGSDGALALGLAHLLLVDQRFDASFVRRWTNGPLLVREDTGRFLRGRDVALGRVDDFVVWDGKRLAPYNPSSAAVDASRFELLEAVDVATMEGEVRCTPAFRLYADLCAQWPPQRVAAVTWVPEADVRALADAIAEAGSVAYHSWTGVGQHTNATQTERAIACLYALTGSFDRPGGNVVQPRVPVNPITSFDQISADQRAKALGIVERPLGPPSQGWVSAHDLYTAILDERPYPVRALFGFGANMLVSQADTERGREALQELDFHVHCNLFMNPTAELADIVLPINSPWEREALRIGFEISHQAQELVQLRQRMLPPIGESRSDIEVIFELAVRLGLGHEFFDGSIDDAWEHVLNPLPFGVEQLRAAPEGIRVELPKRFTKFAEPNEHGRVQGFSTETGRVELYSELLLRHGYDPLPRYVEPYDSPVGSKTDARFPLVLTSTKNSKYCHSQHRAIASLRRRAPEPVLDLSPNLALARGINDGDWVVLRTRHAQIRMKAHLDASLHPSVVVSEYGWWESTPDLGLPGYDPFSERGSNFNRLIDAAQCDPISGSVPLRSAMCNVEPEPTDGSGRRWVGKRPFRIREVEPETPDTVSLLLESIDKSPLADFRPGQHVNLTVDQLVGDRESGTRSYSLSGVAFQRDNKLFRVTIKREGVVSRYLVEQARRGDIIELESPSGRFRLPVEPDLPVVLIAGGVGITPFMSYLETMRRGSGYAPIHAFCSSRDGSHALFGTRLRQLADQMPGLHVSTHYTRPRPQDRPGTDFDVARRFTANDVPAELIRQRARFYLCGPTAMLTEVRAGLIGRGVPSFDVFQEHFTSPTPTWRPDPTLEHNVVFSRSQRTLNWRLSEGTLLTFAERNGINVSAGCRTGECETCAIPVLSGSVHYLVADADPDDEALCLTCQAVPTTDLVLDA